MRMSRVATCLAFVIGLVILISEPVAAYGACTPSNSVTASSFDYVICGLPDLDQVREQTATTPGLPGDGYDYCAPTGTMDAFAYFAIHGVPALRPGKKDWRRSKNYNEMSADILSLGNLMGTTAASGTSGSGYFAGIASWLEEKQPGVTGYGEPLVASQMWVTSPGTSTFAPTLQQMAEDGAAGNVVIVDVMFAQYERPPPPATGPKQWFSVGGHVMGMSSAQSPNAIGLHDPATPLKDHAYQSRYTQQTYTVTPVTATFGYTDTTTGADVTYKATLLRVNNYVNNSLFGPGTQTFIQNYSIIQPEELTTWTPAGIRRLASAPSGAKEAFAADISQPVAGLALDPTAARDFYITHGSPTISVLNTASDTSAPLTTVGSQPQTIAFSGRSQTVFVSDASGLTALSTTGQTINRVLIADHIDALAVDQQADHLLALSADSDRVRIFDSKLNLLGTLQVPQAALAGTGAVSMTVRGGLVYLHRDGEAVVGSTRAAGRNRRRRESGLFTACSPRRWRWLRVGG